MLRVAAAIPAYNAAGTIGSVISQVAAYVGPENIFVVDDGSADETTLIARRKGAWVLRHTRRRGKGSALHDAVKEIIEQDYEWIITLDSDLQHDPGEIPNFLSAAEHFDVVLGKRSISSSGMPFHRFLSNLITSKLISLRTGIDVEDSQCGYRLFRAEVLRKIESPSRHYDYESDILLKAALGGFSIGFVPIKTIYNDSKSSIRVIDVLRFMKVYLKSFA
ncbi:MAG TPA: glycosyltransferase family 2 protein [Candidatus Acidoferrales bacterium]|nr:glycosyltransferase family 2 protein [Candidatus Acidoferrales bacterium]